MKQEKRDDIDTAMLMLIGFGAGALLSAVLFLFLGVFIEAGENETWSLKAVLSGLMSMCISVIIGIIALLYWKLIASKTGVLFPRLNGFKLLLAFASVVPGMALTIGLAYQFIM